MDDAFIERRAVRMYDVYCAAVGGKAYDGRPLPTGAEFFADAGKQKQADAWRAVARMVSVGQDMSFGEALDVMRDGAAVRLPHWSPEVCIRMQVPDEGSRMTHAYLYAQSRFGCVPWIPTQVELLSCEWEVAGARLREKGEPLSATPRRLASEAPARREVLHD